MTGAEGDSSGKSPKAYRTIGEVSEMLGVAQHVLRFWESRFSQIKPIKRAGNRRYYRPEDIALIERIRQLLHDEGYSIRGVQKLLKEAGVKAVVVGTARTELPSGPPPPRREVAPDREEIRAVLAELMEIRDILR